MVDLANQSSIESFFPKNEQEKSVTALIGAPNLSQAMLRPENRAQEMELEFAELKTSW